MVCMNGKVVPSRGLIHYLAGNHPKKMTWQAGASLSGLCLIHAQMEDYPCGDRSHTSEVIASQAATADVARHVRFVIETQPHPPARLAHRGRDERASARTAIRRILWAVGGDGRADRSRISVYRGAASAAAGVFAHLERRANRRSHR